MTDTQPKFIPFNPYLSVGDSQFCDLVKSITLYHHQGDIAWHLASGIMPDINSYPMETVLHIQDKMLKSIISIVTTRLQICYLWI